MPKVYMYPNPDIGKMTKAGVPEASVFLADPYVAEMAEVEAHLGAVANTIAARASGRLMTVKALSETSDGGDGSFIELQHGALDYYIVLNDTRSDNAARAIENDHGILASATPAGQERFAADERDVEAELEKDPVHGGYPDAP